MRENPVRTCSKRIKARSKGLKTRSLTGTIRNFKTDSSAGEQKRCLISKGKNVKHKLDFLEHGEILKEQMFSPITKQLKEIEIKLQNYYKMPNKKINELETGSASSKNQNNFSFETEPSRILQYAS